MANNNLSASALNRVQARLNRMFTGENPTLYPYNEPAITALAMMQRNTANIDPILKNGQVLGYDVHWLRKGASTITYDGTGSGLSLNCDIASGLAPTSAVKTYTDNVRIIANVELQDNLGGNLFDDAPGRSQGITDVQDKAFTLIAERVAAATADIRAALNTKYINFLNSSRTPANHDTNLTDNVVFNDADDVYEAAVSEYNDPDFLTDIEAIVANNDISGYFMVGGRRLFHNARRNADYRRLNDNQRYLSRFDDYDMVHDIKDLDRVLSGSNLFVVGAGTYAAWNRSDSPNSPIQIDEDKWRFYIEDPVLRILDNGVLRPVRYEVVYQKDCAGRDANTHHYFTHKWEIKYLGGLYTAPASEEDAHTGILKFTGTLAA